MGYRADAIKVYRNSENSINEARNILRKYGYIIKPLNEVQFSNKAHVFKEINKLSTQDNFIIKMLLCMYNRQVDNEKSSRSTVLKNYRGFNQADANILSYLAEQYIEFKKLTPMQCNIIKKMLAKYHRQLFEIMCELNLITIRGNTYIFDNEIYKEQDIEEKIDDFAIEMLDMADEFNVNDFIHFAIEHAEEENGILNDDELKHASSIAEEMFYTGASVQAAANRINEEL